MRAGSGQRLLQAARTLEQQSQSAATASYASTISDSAPRWVFLGPPGVGKGTYASRSAKALGVPHIAAGDLVRAEIKSGSPLAQQVHTNMFVTGMSQLFHIQCCHSPCQSTVSLQMLAVVNQGKLLPDAIVLEVNVLSVPGMLPGELP